MPIAALIINVLPKEYSEDCRIKGSISVPFAELIGFVDPMPRGTFIVVYCAHQDCPLSKNALAMLQANGFTHVKAYEGGMREWHQKGYPTEGACTLDYLDEPVRTPKEIHENSISAEELLPFLPL
jgi:rhodanese-related sulfurtransferase